MYSWEDQLAIAKANSDVLYQLPQTRSDRPRVFRMLERAGLVTVQNGVPGEYEFRLTDPAERMMMYVRSLQSHA